MNSKPIDINIKNVVVQFDTAAKGFEKKTNSLANDWKDQRKKEFYSKYVEPYNSTFKNVITELNAIDFELHNILKDLANLRK